MTKAPIGVPIVASLAAFVLVLLALLAGSGQVLEDFAVLTFNTSQLGKNLINSTRDAAATPTCTDTGLVAGTWCQATAAAASVASDVGHEIAQQLAGIEDDVADKLADVLGIEEFYSVHVLSVCRGNYQPNATAAGAWRNVTNCTSSLVGGYNVSSIIDQELGVGPFKFSLNQLGFTRELRDDVDKVHDVTHAFAVIFIVGVGLTGLELLMCLLSLVLVPRRERAVLLLNLGLSALAALALLLAALVSTVGAHVVVGEINEHGADVGLGAEVGTKFEAFVWTGAGLMVVTLAWWVWSRRQFRKGRRLTVSPGEKHALDAPSEAGHRTCPRDGADGSRHRSPAGQGQWGRVRASVVSSLTRSTVTNSN